MKRRIAKHCISYRVTRKRYWINHCIGGDCRRGRQVVLQRYWWDIGGGHWSDVAWVDDARVETGHYADEYEVYLPGGERVDGDRPSFRHCPSRLQLDGRKLKRVCEWPDPVIKAEHGEYPREASG